MCGCRVWLGASVPRGYGVIHHNRRQTYVHRLAWIIAHGEIPAGQFVLHRCDVPACFNVDHLFLGSPRDNTRDMLSKGRARPAFGTRAGKAKLTDDIVREIRSTYKPYDREFGGAALAKKFGVSSSSVIAAARNRYWSHV